MKLSPYQPRHFLSNSLELTDPPVLEPIFARLQETLQAARTGPELEAWLDDWSEVSAAIDEACACRYIEMTCQTDDPDRERAYLKIIEDLEPWLKPRRFALQEALVAHPAFSALPAYYHLYQKSLKTQVALYREKNVDREMEVAKRCQQYQKISGAMTVTFDGKEQTLAQMSRVQEEASRPRRQKAWELVMTRRTEDTKTLEALFDELLRLRGDIAQEAGFQDYRAYIFEANERFDYSPEDCLRFHDSIEKHFVPLARDMQKKRQRELGVDSLRPWDLGVDPQQRPPLRPFQQGRELFDKTDRIFQKIDPRLARHFDLLRERELVDLENRKGKAPGGYQSTLPESRVPFIFMNAVGVQRDVETLLHEAGHAFHAIEARGQRLYAYRGAPIEFCEVASMSMELLGAPHLEEFYSPADAKRARREHLEGILKFFPWVAMVDGFQHWLYTYPHHTPDERAAHWMDLTRRFGGIEDWSGWEQIRHYTWHRQLHIFELPFYYVEYGIAQLGALQLWQQAHERGSTVAVENYLKALRAGGSLPLPELFATAGLKFDFSEATIAPLVQRVQQELLALET